jgi:hypothetical protein
MSFKECIDIIYKDKFRNEDTWVIKSKQNNLYYIDDVTEDGEVYILDDWYTIFISEIDLLHIQKYKLIQRIEELKQYCKYLKKNCHVVFDL